MMIEKEQRRLLFEQFIEEHELTQGQLALWMCQKSTKRSREQIRRKVRGDIGVTTTDICVVNALSLLHDAGFDLGSAEFCSDTGLLKRIEKNG